MASITYEIAKQIILKTQHKWIYELSEGELLEYLKTEKDKRKTDPPRLIRARYKIETRKIAGCNCHIINPGSNRPVVLFLHGGGFILEAEWAHWVAIDKILRASGAEIWFLVYPLLPDFSASQMSAVVLSTYKEMLASYNPQNITVLGDSAGAILAINLAQSINKLDFPRKMILVSPGQVAVKDEKMLAKMKEIEPRDIMLTTKMFDVIGSLMPEVTKDNYELLSRGDFPPLLVFSGTDEVFYPAVTEFVENLKTPVDFIVGDGLCHVWPYVPLVPECEAGLNKIIEAIK
ncbi:MAG: alpha/beta hydrolase [Lactobacillales bacterium]|jgi:acetyl esterase/lipase|nr:alpha/beta hydrolase [Lactobacillales bacterium]